MDAARQPRTKTPHPGRVAAAERTNLMRYGPARRVIKLGDLDPEDRLLAAALIDAMRAHRAAQAANTAEAEQPLNSKP